MFLVEWCSGQEFVDNLTPEEEDEPEIGKQKLVSKFTCRYDIPIENCKEF